MAFKMKGSPMHRNFGIGSPMKQDEMKETERSKKIKEGIKDMSEEEKSKIFKRNLPALSYAGLKGDEEYRERMPDFMQDIATSADSVRAVYHDHLDQKKKKSPPTKKVRVKPKQTLTSFGKIGGWKHANTKLAEEKAAKGKKKYI